VGTSLPDGFQTVVGLEVHCELATATKLFCGCPNVFGREPNTNVCPVCLGLPGSLPVLNKHAVELAMRIGLALHCEVRPSIFHRKNYFYPDMPKDYQISQYDQPINAVGYLELPSGKRVGIVRAHIEEDTGKSTHVGGGGRIHDAAYSLVDYNRAGVPLVEIVSEPDMSSAAEARAYVAELRAILLAVGASDAKMEEGSLRVDANVSVHRPGEPLGTRCEIKNLNSLRSLGHAIEYEAARQAKLIAQGGQVHQETRHWDENAGRTVTLRSKEEAEDYRYFPEPDLVVLDPGQAWIAQVAGRLPELPASRRARLAELLGSRAEGMAEAIGTVVTLDLDPLAFGVHAQGGDLRLAVNRLANEAAAQPEQARKMKVEHFASLVAMESKGELSATQAKVVLAEMLQSGGDPAGIAKAKGFEAMGSDELASVVDRLISDHPGEWERYVAGEDQVQQFLVGQAMRQSKGKVNGKALVEALQARRSGG
jgi:aspartyl-tRNA(Asn)/glutamyl-tRNA(Gln) amidotransferase subunit B